MEQGSKCGRWHNSSSRRRRRRRHGTDDKVKQHSHKVKAHHGYNSPEYKHDLTLVSRKFNMGNHNFLGY